MRGFRLISPGSVEEASALLEEYGDAAAVCAGGTELIPLLKLGLAGPSLLVRLDLLGLQGIGQDDRLVRFGARVTHFEVSGSDVVKGRLPLISQTLAVIANPRVRAVGTLGGSLCFAEPHSDVSTLMLLHDAQVVLSTGRSERRLDLAHFVTGTLTTARHDDEILVAVEVPHPDPHLLTGYERFVIGERPNVAVGCTIDPRPPSGEIARARLVVGCAAPTPMRATEAEAILEGGVIVDDPSIDEAVLEAAESCATECEVYDEDDISAWYKRRLIRVMARRAISKALAGVVPVTPTGSGMT